MQRTMGSARIYLLLFLYSTHSTLIWCYNEESLQTALNPLEPLFRSAQTPYGQKHLKSTPGSIGSGFKSVDSADTHRSQALGPHGQSFIPAVLQSHLLHPRWHADQRKNPAVAAFQVPPIPVLHRSMDDTDVDDAFIGHEGRPLLDSLEMSSSLEQSTSKEIGDNPLLLQMLGANRSPPRVLTMSEQDNDAQSVEMENHSRRAGRTVESIDLIREQLERIKEEEDIETKSNLLMKLLAELPEGPLPIVYVEDASGSGVEDVSEAEDVIGSDEYSDGGIVTHLFTPNGGKRSGRFHLRYPWKRQNARKRPYDDARFLCVPSRDDVFKLLISQRENRIGNHQQKTVSFCNRKRPAKAIFTNIRFLG